MIFGSTFFSADRAREDQTASDGRTWDDVRAKLTLLVALEGQAEAGSQERQRSKAHVAIRGFSQWLVGEILIQKMVLCDKATDHAESLIRKIKTAA
eukprot:1366101-Amorphochlora_amoeboformis.AAC.2